MTTVPAAENNTAAAAAAGAAAGGNRHPVRVFSVAAVLGLAAATLHGRYRADLRAIAADPLGDGLVPIAPRRTRNVTSADGTPLFVAEYGPTDTDTDAGTSSRAASRATAVAEPGTNAAAQAPAADTPTVVLAHGWTCSTDFWTPQLRALAGRCHLVAYDQRGHGRSWNGTTNGFTLDALADDLRAVLDATVPPGRRSYWWVTAWAAWRWWRSPAGITTSWPNASEPSCWPVPGFTG